jgi:cytochrome c553
MKKWAVGLLAVVVVVGAGLKVVSRHAGKGQKTLAVPTAGTGSNPTVPAATMPAATAKMPYAQRFAGLCAACHGLDGRMETPLSPVLAGQPSLYAITQLYLFREGRRGNEAMTAVAKTLTDDDLRGFSDLIATLPPVPPPPPATPPDPSRMARGQALAEQHKCLACHGADLGGGEQVPRIGGQHEDYLQASLRGFHTGARPGYTQAMSEAVSQIPEEDLDTLAYFAARFVGPAGAVTGK